MKTQAEPSEQKIFQALKADGMTDQQAKGIIDLSYGTKPDEELDIVTISRGMQCIRRMYKQSLTTCDSLSAQLTQANADMLVEKRERHSLYLQLKDHFAAESDRELVINYLNEQVKDHRMQISILTDAHSDALYITKHDMYRYLTHLVRLTCKIFGLRLKVLCDLFLVNAITKCEEAKQSFSTTMVSVKAKKVDVHNKIEHANNVNVYGTLNNMGQ